MSKYFFSGGMMPADQLFYNFQDDLKIENQWQVNGQHYEKTSRAWLDKMDSSKEEILKIFEKTYGKGEGLKWLRYWRVFFMASEELFAYDQGREWYVSHYLLKK
jgi:cyclopropane-fatty-acyl-phospholipid synthase